MLRDDTEAPTTVTSGLRLVRHSEDLRSRPLVETVVRGLYLVEQAGWRRCNCRCADARQKNLASRSIYELIVAVSRLRRRSFRVGRLHRSGDRWVIRGGKGSGGEL